MSRSAGTEVSKKMYIRKVSGIITILVLTFVFGLYCSGPSTALPPTGLLCELMEHPEHVSIATAYPHYGWIANDSAPNAMQSAYQVLVASSLAALADDVGDVWDSGKVIGGQSITVRHAGEPLAPDATYHWKVRTWNDRGQASPWSESQTFHTGAIIDAHITTRYPLVKAEVAPLRMVKTAPDMTFIDFGRAAYGTIKLTLTSQAPRDVEVHLGEVAAGKQALDRNPGRHRRYRMMVLPLKAGTYTYTVAITPDERNTENPKAIRMPVEVGEVMPFRYCELAGYTGPLDTSDVRQVVVHYPFNNDASYFSSSSQVLNDVWDLCKYTIKATSFCGVYVDGDRERIPYEADAYINQLGHYSVDREFTLARYTHEYLITNPTWPTEWIMHSILMAWADYMQTGDAASLARFYDDLRAKTLGALARGDGLISTRTGLVTNEVLTAIHFQGRLRDLVDWPQPGETGLPEGQGGETDNFDFRPINTVVNAFHYRALVLMSRIADVLGKNGDASSYSRQAARVKSAFNEVFLDKTRSVYIDGEGSSHSSLHANMFPLAFGLVPEPNVPKVVAFVKSRGMACSVYGSQYLLEALYQAGEAEHALKLLTATDDRSWAHMIYDVGTTITLEAWDRKYKPNLDWNHAWGVAPANIIPRWLMGVRPLEPGYGLIQIKPRLGGLEWGTLELPTIRGTVHVDARAGDDVFRLKVRIPTNTRARVCIPAGGGDDPIVKVDGRPRKGQVEGDFVVFGRVGSGEHTFERPVR